MAEGFARVYGSDVMTAMSAGLTPAVAVPDETIQTMDEKNIDIRRQFPKSWRHLAGIHFDLIVNLSGNDVPAGLEAPVRTWKVPDPYLYEYPHYCKTRDQIENLVMGLILELRRAQSRKAAR